MESEILPIIEEFLSEEHLLEKKDYEVSINQKEKYDTVSGIYVQIFLKKVREEICSWSEFSVDNETLFYIGNGIFRKNKVCLDILKLVIRENKHLYTLQMEKLGNAMKQNCLLEQKNKELLEHNEKLRAKNREFRYSPGERGFLKAEKHFIGLM
ncbi:hypothetical protein A9K97_gp446 [Tokyovirus A1]|uniref:hypothetical protein n=1 Tax=Tokyovirus A1 TaxID=1826170 RepID=UPI0007A98C19|nr:hypothetical protein A9K97_gp446 [Tokyovirus A1]BAU79905.1 hypothetical protein [Tokyovirus A1]